MEPFVQAARLVLREVSGGGATAGPLGLLGNTFPTAATNIAAKLEGTLAGDVVYSMSVATAEQLAGNLAGREVHGFGRLMGAGLTELGKLLSERTSRLLAERGHECEVSAPVVFQGLNVEFTMTEPALAASIQTNVGQVNVSVAVTDGTKS